MFREIHDEQIEKRAAAPEIGLLLARYHASVSRHGTARLEELSPAAQPDLAGDLVLLKPVARNGFVYLAYGERISAVTGLDLTGKTLDCLGGDLRRFYRETYRRALRDGRPLYTNHRSTYALDVYSWERLVLPLRDAAGDPFIVVLNKPRELRNDLLGAVLAASRDGIFAMRARRDEAGRLVDCEIVTANARAAEICRRPCDALVGGSLMETFPGLVETGIWDVYAGVIEHRRTQQFETFYDLDGLEGCFRVTAVPLHDGLTVSLTDITEMKAALRASQERNDALARVVAELEAARAELALEVRARRTAEGELRRIASLDHLTGVLNRRGFDRAVRRCLDHSGPGEPVSVVAMDVDHFKTVNDRFGHATGDAVLVHVASLLRETVRGDIDAIGRVGGEEFMILLPGLCGAAAGRFAEELRERLLLAPAVAGGHAVPITASFGVASLRRRDAERMLIDADEALYAAKRAGRDRVVVHDPDDTRLAVA
ncbi:MAG TPA: diguanylate cyclase [Salinarimonas sp.]|nr:diguanylate cyclase [Salinarimonas sp.]